ncbi:tRNA (adenosine(37)-N6)-dimethylallyltransferase MiaA [Nitratifractor sp.]
MNTDLPGQIALIGSTASGKSSLALELARKSGAVILSLDSLSIYREIDIASAKPGPEERGEVPHYGIDILFPDEPFDVIRYLDLYRLASSEAAVEERPLIVVGGSSFYLKILLEGISPLPPLDTERKRKLEELMKETSGAYRLLEESDPRYAKRIAPSDRYRIEKAVQIFLATGMTPTEYFRRHPPRPVITTPLPLFEITRGREELRERITLRTDTMLEEGLIDEVAMLEYRYGRAPNPMKAIGIREVLDYFDGVYSYGEMRERIIIHTAQLAKRQQTFNRSQFGKVVRGSADELKEEILPLLR